MAQWRNRAFLSGSVIAVVVLGAILTSKPEPSYQGRSLSSWLETYGAEMDNAQDVQKGGAAIRHIGTNSLPFLLRWTSYEPPHYGIHRDHIFIWRIRPDEILPLAVQNWIEPSQKGKRANLAARSFELFKDQAQPVIPRLDALMNDRRYPVASRNAVVALTSIGRDAIPVLAAQLAKTNAPNRRLVIRQCALYPELATNVDFILPQLIRCLDDHDPWIRLRAGQSLSQIAQRFQPQPAIVVPVLIQCLRTGSRGVPRISAILGLYEYGVQARAAVPILLQMTADPDEKIRNLVTNTLLNIAPESIANPAPLR